MDPISVLLSLILIVSVRSDCGLPSSIPWPWEANLVVLGEPVCSAVLISPQFLLTTGECGEKLQKGRTLAYLGISKLSMEQRDDEQIFGVLDVIYPGDGYDDVALVQLGSTVREYSPICLPTANETVPIIEDGQSTFVVDWINEDDSAEHKVMKPREVPVVDSSLCGNLNRKQFCAGFEFDPRSHYDHGAPLITYDPTQRVYKLLGVLSNQQDPDTAYITVNDVAAHMHWTQAIVQAASKSPFHSVLETVSSVINGVYSLWNKL